MADIPLPEPQSPEWLARAPRISSRRIFLLWLPATLIATAILLPVLYLVLRAFQGETSLWQTIISIQTLRILWNSVALAVSVTVLSALIAIPTAWLTTRTDLPHKRIWSILTALPLVIPSYIGAFLMVSALGPKGLVQGWLEPLGVERLPPIYGFPGAAITLTLLNYPYILLSIRAALQGMDPSIEEAARVLGHGPWKTFWRVILPQLRPGLVAGGLLIALYSLRDFGAVAIMRYDTFTRALFVQYKSLIDRSGAAKLALVLILLTLVILAVDWKTRQNNRIYSSQAATRPASIIRLGRWKWPALVFLGGVVFFALAIPSGVLVYWLARGLQAGETLTALWPATQNSVFASGLAAGATLLAALPFAILSVRYPGRRTSMLERVTYIGFALPGVVVALALVFFGANYARVFYQTLPLLVFAYLILFLPQMVSAIQTSMLQVHTNLEEAGRSLGKTPLTIFRKVTLPLVRPGIASGAALVFLTTMKELPATLILGPFGFKTLATSVWSAVSEAFFAQAAAPALLLIIVSSIPMAFLVLPRRL